MRVKAIIDNDTNIKILQINIPESVILSFLQYSIISEWEWSSNDTLIGVVSIEIEKNSGVNYFCATLIYKFYPALILSWNSSTELAWVIKCWGSSYWIENPYEDWGFITFRSICDISFYAKI